MNALKQKETKFHNSDFLMQYVQGHGWNPYNFTEFNISVTSCKY